ncbi:helix-turn-helix transcriptional regulator [Paenibacillus sp. UNC496MF]|uniref:helix-turn-helix transcriptional regulator n=1 Tax=Paenibacillus sp. UNC496MF TaxID=1502753 RepID=UPI0015A70C81|nr:helix-turn-helix transcriptional regulator [Paenibacillus sp. UNC496MF]
MDGLIDLFSDPAHEPELCRQFMELAEGESVSKTGVAVDIFYSMVSMFIAHLNRWGLMKTVTERFNLNQLFNIGEHATRRETTARFEGLAKLLFEETASKNEKQTSDVFWKVQVYIRDNLGGDLSLTKLAKLVYLSPSYLSKLYKQETCRASRIPSSTPGCRRRRSCRCSGR